MVAKSPVAATRANLPDVAGLFKTLAPEDRAFLRELLDSVAKELERRAPVGEAIEERLLFSPNGSVYALTVDDLGAVVTTPKYVTP
jgi:hypothetical protein